MFKAIKNFFTASLEDDMVRDETEAMVEEIAQEERYCGITRWADSSMDKSEDASISSVSVFSEDTVYGTTDHGICHIYGND